jgi:hypothetical protein
MDGRRSIATLPYNATLEQMDPTFEWDEQKNRDNQLKHGVSFEEA